MGQLLKLNFIQIRRLLIITLATAIFSSPLGVVRAGGWISADAPIKQTDLEVVFLVDGPTITAIYYFGYHGNAHDFVWIIPLPSQPESFGEYSGSWAWRSHQGGWFGEFALPMQITTPPEFCDAIRFRQYDPNYDPIYDVESTTADNQSLHSGDEIIPWLARNHYTITDDTEQTILGYARQGMLFLAVQMKQDIPSTTIPYEHDGVSGPFYVKYKADHITLPLRLVATSAVEHMPIQMWILGNSRYVPQNAIEARVNFANLHSQSDVMELVPSEYRDNANGYENEVFRTVSRFNQPAFVTQYAGPSIKLSKEYTDPSDLIARYPYVTRLFTAIPSGKNITDPVLVPAPNAPQVSNAIDLNHYVDPLDFWGCSTRSAAAHIGPLQDVPDGRAIVFGTNIAYPVDWVSSELMVTPPDLSVKVKAIIFAPRHVSDEDLQLALDSKPPVPMFVAYELASYDAANFPLIATPPPYADSYGDHFVIRFLPQSDSLQAVIFAVFTTTDDWENHQTMYRSMLTYASLLPYYLHPELRYSLFLNDVYVGFPDGWKEQVKGNEVQIVSGDGAASVRIRKSTSLLGLSDQDISRFDQDQRKQLAAALDAEYSDSGSFFIQNFIAGEDGCIYNSPPFIYTHQRREGLFLVDPTLHYIVDISATHNSFQRYEHILKAIRDSVIFQLPC